MAVLLVTGFTAEAGKPAFYSPANDRVFWFIHVSDPHIGASGSTDADPPAMDRLHGPVRHQSSVHRGHGGPDGFHQREPLRYSERAVSGGMGRVQGHSRQRQRRSGHLLRSPRNHDAYNDATFAYYRANAVQGRATGKTQLSWIKTFPFGTYHFLGVNTADNTGAPFP